jgi:hypothetical protein
MKILVNKIVFVIALISITACASTMEVTNKEQAKLIEKCPDSKRGKPINFVVIEIENGLPVDALIPKSKKDENDIIKILDLNNSDIRFESIVFKNPLIKKDHGAKRKSRICFVSVEASSSNATKFKFSPEKILVLWRPDQEIDFKNKAKNIAFESIPEFSPFGVKYKFSIATSRSDPEVTDTYLDPRIIIKR